MRSRFSQRRPCGTRRFPGRSPRSPLQLEQLENRLAPALITVTTTADDITPNDGSVSLREAITAINAGNNIGDPDIIAQNPGIFGTNDTIKFNIPGTAPFQINVGSSASAANIPLPALTKLETIDGTTQTGFAGAPIIVVNGLQAGTGANGFDIQLGAQPASAGVTLKGLVINQFNANGILIEADNVTGFGLTASTITLNFIGTNAAGTAALGNQQNGILIDATNSNATGLAASDNVISNNVISGNNNDGVLIRAHSGVAAGNTLTGNSIGVNVSSFPTPNSGDGITIDGASGNSIGTAAGSHNIVSSNAADGIHIIGTVSNPATANILADNFIGVDPSGKAALGNQRSGVEVSGGDSTNIGGNVVGANNDGIELDNGAQSNLVQGNFVGVGVDGASPVGNKQHGIVLHSNNSGATEPGVINNLIGGIGQGDGNAVAFNGSAGIAVFGNPVAGSGQANTGNTFEGNSVFQNGRTNPSALLGIDLSNQFRFPMDDGITTNDSRGHGAANDPNNFQNFPVLNSVTPANGGTEIKGTLTESAAPTTTFRIDYFTSNPDPQNGVPEGQFLLGTANVTTNGSGSASFDVTVPARVAGGQFITATATDSAGNTSEFSAAVAAPTATQFYVSKVFHDLLARAPDANGLAFWTSQLNNRLSPAQLVFSIETDSFHEYYSDLVRSFYQLYLHRAVLPAEQSIVVNMANFLAAGGRIEQLRASFTASPEYFQTRAGNSFSPYVDAVYLDAFGTPGRVASDPGAAAFMNQLSNGSLTRGQFTNIIFNSDEFFFDLVQSYYQQFLNRTGAPDEINDWTPLLKQGASGRTVPTSISEAVTSPSGSNSGLADQIVIASILGSPEVFSLASASPALPALALRNPKSISPDLYGPLFSNVPLNGRPNIKDLYVFRSPSDVVNVPNFGNTDLVATVSPFAGVLTPTSFDPRMTLDLNVVNTNGQLTPNFTFVMTFAPPTPAGSTFNQVVTLRLIQGNTTTTIAQYTYVGNQTIPPAAFANNITFPGDAVATGRFIVGAFDDPAFLDAQGFTQFASNPNDPGNPFPRPVPAKAAQPLPTNAKNFYHNANTLAVVLEVPTTKLTTANPPLLGVWADSKFNGTQVDRLGRPLIDAGLIPPVPRNDMSRPDHRTAFNLGSPSTDVANFRADVIAVLTSPNFIYQRSQADAAALVDAAFGKTILGAQTGLLPDMLTVDLSLLYTDATNGFPNGRRFRDDVVDFALNLLTKGKVTTDNVIDDNGTIITDGLGGVGSVIMFPYIGKPNNPPGGPNP